MLTPLGNLFGSMPPLGYFLSGFGLFDDIIKKITNGRKTKTNESSKTNTSPIPSGKGDQNHCPGPIGEQEHREGIYPKSQDGRSPDGGPYSRQRLKIINFYYLT